MINFRINRLEIYGFKDELRKILIKFSKEQTTAIYGKNGAGKTTVFKLINAIFNRDTKTLFDEKVKRVCIEFEKDKKIYWIELKLKKETRVFGDEERSVISYNWSDIDFIKENTLMITTDRGLSDYRRRINIEDIMSYMQNNEEFNLNNQSSYSDLKKFVQFINIKAEKLSATDLYSKENLYLDNIKMETIEELCKDRYEEIEKLKKHQIKLKIYEQVMEVLLYEKSENKLIKEKSVELLSENKIKELSDKVKKYDSIIEEIFKNDNDEKEGLEQKVFNVMYNMGKTELKFNNQLKLSNRLKKKNADESLNNIAYLNKIIEIMDDNSEKLFCLKKIEDTFNKFVNYDKRLVINKNDLYVEVRNQNHKISELSNGEKHLLTFLVVLSFIGMNKNIIMIDEPGISLNTEWQELLVEQIENICPNSQILLSTHSPDISINNSKIMTDLETEYMG